MESFCRRLRSFVNITVWPSLAGSTVCGPPSHDLQCRCVVKKPGWMLLKSDKKNVFLNTRTCKHNIEAKTSEVFDDLLV